MFLLFTNNEVKHFVFTLFAWSNYVAVALQRYI